VGHVASLCVTVLKSVGYAATTHTFWPITSITDDMTWYKYMLYIAQFTWECLTYSPVIE